MPNCKINGCLSKFSKGIPISFFSVPSIQPERSKWISAIENYQEFDYSVQNYYICSLHFEPSDIASHGKRRTVIKGKLPSIFPRSISTDIIHTGVDTELDSSSSCCLETQNTETHELALGWIFGELLLEFDDDEQQSQPSTRLEDTVSVSREKYKQLVDESVELVKQNKLNEKLKNIIKNKCAHINELKKVLGQHKYLFKKTESKKTQHETNCSENSPTIETSESIDINRTRKEKKCIERKQLEFLECLRFGNSYKKYSATIRMICFTLHYYSPKAYEYLRSIFNNNLPTSRTLRAWLSNIDNSPGFTQCAFDALKEKAVKRKKEGKDLIVGLIFDEMSIRRHSQWDNAKKEYLGHITAGRPVEYEEHSPLAKEALLLMVSGINIEFKIPIGYFLSFGLCGAEKAAILDQTMNLINQTGAILASMTSDGAKPNKTAYQLLGADFKNEMPYFTNPYDDMNKIYVVWDPPHMLKLIRNLIHNKQIMDSEGNKIMWELIVELVSMQISKNINLSNKLTKTHIEYENVKMNVRIACETISNSTASAIEFLDKVMNNGKFANSAGTVHLIRTFNNIFDVMNTKKGHTDKKYKRPISAENLSDITAYFDLVKDYIRGLTMVEGGKKVLKTDSYTPLFGFLHNLHSFLAIYRDYVVRPSSGIEELYTFSVSQDHVESFFGCVRQMGGNNCNPTAQQFAGAYRKLLFQNEVSSSDMSNCQNDITKVLEVSSHTKNVPLSANPVELQSLLSYDGEVPDALFDNQLDGYDQESDDNDEKAIDNHSKAYLASKLEQKVTRKVTLQFGKGCLQCANTFDENEKINNIFINFLNQNKRVRQPCKSTMNIITIVENAIKKYNSQDISVPSIVAHILQIADLSPLYESSDFGDQHDHKFEFIKLVIEEYLNIKCVQISRLVTRLSQKKLLRHHHLKEIHREGQ